jgi:hypothetical protein
MSKILNEISICGLMKNDMQQNLDELKEQG